MLGKISLVAAPLLLAPAFAPAAAGVVAAASFHGLLVVVLVLMGLPLLKLAALSLKVLALSRHSARRAMPAAISGASGATCAAQQGKPSAQEVWSHLS
jgi:hypothetical protein